VGHSGPERSNPAADDGDDNENDDEENTYFHSEKMQ
jgi:hypothetical protein